MALVASVDYPNQRIYLGIGSANTRLDTLDVFREVRTLRATTEAHRRHPPIIASGGNVRKTSNTATAKFVKLTAGTLIVPYDGNHTITLTRDTFTEDELSGTDVFDLSLLSPTTSVNIKEDIPQVEVITVSTGSGLDSSQDSSLNNIEIIASKLDSLIEDVSGHRFTAKALEVAPSSGGSSIEPYTVTSLNVVEGTTSSGTVSELQTRNSLYSITDETSSGLEVIAIVGASDVAKEPYALKIVGYYSSTSSAHHVDIQCYNYDTNTWEQLGKLEARSTSFEYVFSVVKRHQHPSTGEVKIRFIHNQVASYNPQHKLYLDFISLEKSLSNPEMLSSIAQILSLQQSLSKRSVISSGTIVSSSSSSSVLSEASDNNEYLYQTIEITEGIGIGQSRLILSYDSSTQTIVLDRDWLVQPQSNSKYEIKSTDTSVLANIKHEGTIKKLRSQIQTLQ